MPSEEERGDPKPGDLEGHPMHKASSQERSFHSQVWPGNSYHDSGMWPGSRKLRNQNIKAALCVGVGLE